MSAFHTNYYILFFYEGPERGGLSRTKKEATSLFWYIVIPPTCDVLFDPVKVALGFIEEKEVTKIEI